MTENQSSLPRDVDCREVILGYDARIVPVRLGTMQCSVDVAVWPSVFAGSGDGRVAAALRPNDSVVLFGDRGAGELWKNLEYLEYCLRANGGRIGTSYDIVAVGLVDGEGAYEEPGSPAQPQPRWELLGYEVAEESVRAVGGEEGGLILDRDSALAARGRAQPGSARALRVYALWRVDRVIFT